MNKSLELIKINIQQGECVGEIAETCKRGRSIKNCKGRESEENMVAYFYLASSIFSSLENELES